MAFTPLPPIAAPSKKNRKLPYLIAGAVIVVAALVVAGIVVFGRSGGDNGNIASRKAGGAVEDAANAAHVPRDAPGVALRTCPIGGLDQLADKAPAGFDAQKAASGLVQNGSSVPPRNLSVCSNLPVDPVSDRSRKSWMSVGGSAAATTP